MKRAFCCGCIVVLLSLSLGAAVVVALPPLPPNGERPFLGSIHVNEGEREQVIRYLHERGFKNTYVPPQAAPETLLYRSSKSEYEAAIAATWELRAKEKPAPERRPTGRVVERRAGGARTDEAIFAALGLTEKQSKELKVLQQEMREATAKMKAMREGHVEEGLRINQNWRAGLQRILTKEQWQKYLDYWQAGPAR